MLSNTADRYIRVSADIAIVHTEYHIVVNLKMECFVGI